MKTWTEMTARERDALVAEKVMGWVWLVREEEYGGYKRKRGDWHPASFLVPPDGPPVPYGVLKPAEEWDMLPTERERINRHSHTEAPRFTTRIAPAWEVVKKLVADNWYPDLTTTYDHIPKGLVWICQLHHADVDDAPFGASAYTAAEAICLAALRAKGVDV